MQISRLAETSTRLSQTSRRLEKVSLIAGVLRDLAAEEILPAVSYLSGDIPQGKTGIGYATLRATSDVPGAPEPSLTILDVDRALAGIAAVSGSGAEKRRKEQLSNLLALATPQEQRFLRALLTGELRQGALEGVMLDAIAKASGAPAEKVRRAVMMAGGIAGVAQALFLRGEAAFADYDVSLFRPVQPMLAQPADDVADALEALGEAALEYKYDGARIQVHRSGDEIAVYSRSLKDVTAAVPEVVQAARALPARDLIIDGEVLSFDERGRAQPFQVTARRFGRRLDLERIRQELPLTPVWFDLLYQDGGTLLDEPQVRRFALLSELSAGNYLVPHVVTSDRTAAEDFLHRSLSAGNEGLMAKSREAVYAAGARGQSWWKVKNAKTLDLVILAAEWGSGRRQGWLSNLHLGARDTVSGGFAMLGKTFKGLTDEMLAWQTERLLALEAARDRYTVYVEPKIVVEIAYNDIQISPRYASGLALRFARVKRYRTDKTPADADTFQTVQQLASEALGRALKPA